MRRAKRCCAFLFLWVFGGFASACDSDGSMALASECLCELPERKPAATALLPQACFWTHRGEGYGGAGEWRAEDGGAMGIIVERETNEKRAKRKTGRSGAGGEKGGQNAENSVSAKFGAADEADRGGEKRCVDINAGGIEDLMMLPGVGKARAQAIVKARTKRPFRNPSGIMRVKGIGKKAFKKMSAQICPF